LRAYILSPTTHWSRTSSVGGGVGLYIHNDYVWKQRDDLVLDGPDFECIFVELTDPSVIIGCIGLYRKPYTDIKTFNISLDKLLTIINIEKKIGYILGDFNINILKSDVHVDTCSFVDCLFSNMFLPIVTCPLTLLRRQPR